MKHEVTCLAKSPDRRHLAVGYNNGSIKVFDLTSGDSHITFSGHKSAVSALNYDQEGVRLVSGANVSYPLCQNENLRLIFDCLYMLV